MSTTTKPDARPLPFGVRRLPDAEHVACKACGTTCGPSAPRETFAIVGRADPHLGTVDARSEATFGVCPACARLAEHAARTLDAHPLIRNGIGSPSIGLHRVLSAFYALAVMGAEPADTYTHDGLLSLLDRMSAPGAAAPWFRDFAPVWMDGAIRDTATSEPWLHVGTELRAEIRRQYGDHLADRMPPRAVSCPTGGCAWCGVASVMAKRTATPWTPHSMSPSGLGGNGPRALAVHLCPTCEHARADGGSMRSAVLDHVDPFREMRRRRPYEPEVSGVRGWAVLGDTPNVSPWAHLDLDGLRALLASANY